MSDPIVQQAGLFADSVVNVKDHGATGDGLTDDTAALKAAIAASQEGDAVYFPAGTYLVSQPLRPKAHQVYFSLTDLTTLKARPGVTGFLMFDVRLGPVEFYRLALDLAKDETQAPQDPRNATGILVRAPDVDAVDVVISGCRIRNAHGHGIRVAGANGAGHDRVIVRDTVVENCGLYGLALGQVNNAQVESSRFEGCRNGVLGRLCRDVVVHGVTANENERHGIAFLYSQGWHVDQCVARGNGSGADGWGITAGGDPEDPPPPPNSEFTITNNVCEGNAAGGITLDPTVGSQFEVIQFQRARVSGNVCRNAVHHHGIHLTHARDVVVTDNVCTGNKEGCGIAVVSSSHVLVQANLCTGNRNGIGLFSHEKVLDPGHHVIGVNLLYGNDFDIQHSRLAGVLGDVRLHGLHGDLKPEGNVQADPGTLYEWHDGDQGALYVKQSGSETTGWRQLAGI
jgi:parallel beta-helix repeat protein